jgi:hypothetical protein
MKKIRFTESQIVAIFKEADAGMKLAPRCHIPGRPPSPGDHFLPLSAP